MALTHRGRPTGAIVHSDCGSQFRPAAFTAMIKTHAVWPPPWEPSESAPTTQPRGSFFLPAPGNKRLNRYVWDTPNQLRFRSMDMGATHVARTQRSGLVPVLRRPGGIRLRVWRWSFSRRLLGASAEWAVPRGERGGRSRRRRVAASLCVCGHCETLTAGFRVSGTEAARSGVVVQDEAASMA